MATHGWWLPYWAAQNISVITGSPLGHGHFLTDSWGENFTIEGKYSIL